MNPPLLTCEGLYQKINGATALEDVTFSLPKGSLIGLFGPKHSGKTTLMQVLSGCCPKDAGHVILHGAQNEMSAKEQISYIPFHCALPLHMSTEELLAFYAASFQGFERDRAKALLAALQVDTKKRLKELSVGTRGKIQFILGMSRKASLYLLDNPFQKESAKNRAYLARIISQARTAENTVLIAVDDADALFMEADSYLLLAKGKTVSFGSVTALCEEKGMPLSEALKGLIP